eukprot:gene5201-6485_t
MTPSAVEYLVTVARAVCEGSNGFLSASFVSPVTPAKTEDFVGIWDISELMKKYAADVEFHLLPMTKLQKFFDCHEILLFCEVFLDFKLSRDGRFTLKQLESLKDTYRQARERSDSLGSDVSKGWGELEAGAVVSSGEASEPGSRLFDEIKLEPHAGDSIDSEVGVGGLVLGGRLVSAAAGGGASSGALRQRGSGIIGVDIGSADLNSLASPMPPPLRSRYSDLLPSFSLDDGKSHSAIDSTDNKGEVLEADQDKDKEDKEG